MIKHTEYETILEDQTCNVYQIQLQNKSIPWSLQTITEAGRPLDDVTRYEELNPAMLDQPWSSFCSEHQFNLARWVVWNRESNTRIDNYFNKGLGGMEHKLCQSSYTLEKQLHTH